MNPVLLAILAAAGIAWAATRDPSPSGMTPNRRGGRARVVESYRKRRGKRHVVGRESRKRALEFKARRGTKWEKPSSTKRSIQQRREAMKTLVEAQRYEPGEYMIRFHTTNPKQGPKVKRWLKKSGLRLTEHGQVVSEAGMGREDWGSIGTDHHGDALDIFVDARRTFAGDVKNGTLGITVAIPSPNPRKEGRVKYYTAGGGRG